jgi:hypothetical protein
MFFAPALLVAALTALAHHAAAYPPHLVTHVDGGHNIIAKLPCVGCPLLVRGDDGEWAETRGESALVRKHHHHHRYPQPPLKPRDIPRPPPTLTHSLTHSLTH